MNGRKIRDLLYARDIRISAAAASIGESQQNFSAMLNSKDVKSSVVERLAAALGMPVSELYGERAHAVSVNSNNTNNGHDMNIGDCASLVDKALTEIAEQRKLAQSAIDLANRLIRQ